MQVQLTAGGGKRGRAAPRLCERLGGPRQLRGAGGIGSREGSWRGPRLLASGAGACEQAHEAGGTCTYGNPAGNHPAVPIASLHMNSTWSIARLHTGGLSWVDSPGQRRASVKTGDECARNFLMRLPGDAAATGGQSGHMTVYCNAPGYRSAWYQPRHEP
jgi:hypothetical protein